MRPTSLIALAAAFVLSHSVASAQVFMQNDADATVRQSEQVLAEIMAIPAKSIPEYLLAEAQGIVIVPNVIKIGFIAGVRRGHGVVMVRDAEGEWSLPQFVTLTGGSVGWQAGIQGTDVVLVFTTRKGVDGLLQGKFTIGADASASAGPVGRNASASTDATLKSEILSYSRSRGLFLGVAIDGSVLEIDNQAHVMYYGSPSSELPRAVPQSAIQLRQFLVDATAASTVALGGVPAPVAAVPVVPGATVVAGAAPPAAIGPRVAVRPSRPGRGHAPGVGPKFETTVSDSQAGMAAISGPAQGSLRRRHAASRSAGAGGRPLRSGGARRRLSAVGPAARVSKHLRSACANTIKRFRSALRRS